jgi:hypothetical protein
VRRSHYRGLAKTHLQHVATAVAIKVEPEFEEPRHTSASSRRQNKENQGGLRLFCSYT